MNCREIVRLVGLELNKLKTRELICRLCIPSISQKSKQSGQGVYVLFLWTEYWV